MAAQIHHFTSSMVGTEGEAHARELGCFCGKHLPIISRCKESDVTGKWSPMEVGRKEGN